MVCSVPVFIGQVNRSKTRSGYETWLYIEVVLMYGSGILGLGQHSFWIGTPEYWLSIGGFFSALEPVPLVAMVVHAVYDSGVHKMRSSNHPAMDWLNADCMCFGKANGRA